MTKELPKQYNHAEAQQRWYQYWEEQGCFRSSPNPDKQPFTIVIPPPNVTGALHLGHALNNTLQDSLIRYKRMQGFEALWVPGTDHAGIATQAVVERRLKEQENLTRHDVGRESLIERIWAWKHQYEQRILSQLKKMGCSCDWERTRFTLDDICARAVRHTFFGLFRDGLIYRGKRLVNWDTFLQTAVSDDEVFHDPIKGKFWHFRYPVIDPQPGEPPAVEIATTRPETMLGDTAVAVHPDPAGAFDKIQADLQARLQTAPAKERPAVEKHLEALAQRRGEMLAQLEKLRDMAVAGRKLRLPLLDREIPLVTDVWAKPELGTGAVKITPAHDPNDYEVGIRQKLPMINILNKDGTLNEEAGPYAGLTIKKARTKVVEDLDELGLLGEIEDREIELAHSDRSKTPIEPLLVDQWFVKMDQLAQTAMDAVTEGKVTILPSRYTKSYLDWLKEKRDWPIGRQLWWGHRIPIWYCATCTEEELKQAFAGRDDVWWFWDAHYNQWLICAQEEDLAEDVIPGHQIEQDPDVLDTWFSSALWPHSTLGWPEQTPELEYYYPTSVLITSRDIITLWVARMVLTGLYNVGEVPFHQVFIHPKILDGDGETMSKTKGNGVDPLDVIQQSGADALRFGLAYLTTETQDARLPVEFACPHCGHTFPQTKKNRKQPTLECPECKKGFSTQWAETAEEQALPRGSVTAERFETARNFCNKLWNASRFTLMNLEDYSTAPLSDEELRLEDRWLLSRLNRVIGQVTAAFEQFRYSDIARTLYSFAWDEFCSFFVEMVKYRLQDAELRPAAQRVLAYTLDRLLRLLHPITPFVTEEVWHLLNEYAPQRGLKELETPSETLMLASWPKPDESWLDERTEARFTCFQEMLSGLREVRNRQNVPPKETLEFSVRCSAAAQELVSPLEPYFASLAGAKAMTWGEAVTAPATSSSFNFSTSDPNLGQLNYEVFVDLRAFIDFEKEVARKEKDREKLIKAIDSKEKKLSNPNFAEKAPAEVVSQERERLAQLQEELAGLDTTLEELRAQLQKS